MIGSRFPNEDSQIDNFLEIELARIPQKKKEVEDEKKDEVEQSAFISGENPLEPFSTNGGPTGNNR